jgi:outer membrane protein
MGGTHAKIGKGESVMEFKKRMKWIGFGVIVIAVIFAVNMLAYAAVKPTPVVKSPESTVGYVDMDRIQKEYPDFIKLAEITKDQQELFDMTQNSIKKQLDIVTKEIKDRAEKEKAGKTAEEQTKIDQKYQAELQSKSNELTAQLKQKYDEIMKYITEQTKAAKVKVDETVSEVAKEKKLTIVLDKKVVFYGGVDITQAVLDKAKGISNTPAPASK